MKKLSLLLVLAMLVSCISIPVLGEDAAKQVTAGGSTYYLAEASGDQAELGYADASIILEADGLKFKDLNRNGTLDPYEDWRLDTEERITDLLAQMSIEQKVNLLFHCMSAGQFSPTYPMDDQFLYEKECPFEGNILNGRYPDGYSFWYYIVKLGITHYLDDATGTPKELVEYHNKVQAIAEQEGYLGIPITFTANRESNTWGSYVDMPHDALGTANDPELAQKLWKIYGEEMKALGYHVTLNPFGVEIGSWYGEDPAYIANLTDIEVKAMQSSGLAVCVKHFIARGGDSSFGNARSVAQNVDNWMYPWKAAIDAGCEWIMTNTGTGLTNSVRVDYDKTTMAYLRDTLGFDGVVVTDWGPAGSGISGVTIDGIDLGQLDLAHQYTMMLENGVDQFGAVSVMPGEDPSVKRDISNWPDALVRAVKEGFCSEELVDRSARRILRTKFSKGLFENPYVDLDACLQLVASAEYIVEPWEIDSNESLDRARNPETVELDHQLQAKSTVLVKNDDNLLPLSTDTKVYVTGNVAKTAAMDAEAFAKYAAVVDDPEEADVIVARITALDDNAELIFEDAAEYGKKLVLALDHVDPSTKTVEKADAILFLNYNVTCDHGSSLDFILRATEPWILADMVFGTREPGGIIVKEIARSAELDDAQWKDLAGDSGASAYVRLLVEALMKTSETYASPNNFGDPLLCYQYGMRYGQDPAFRCEILVVPTEVIITEVPTGWGGMQQRKTTVNRTQKSGETFTIDFLVWNDGGDGMTTIQVKDGETVVGEKIMAVNGGSWRVCEMEIALEGAGEHTITVGDMSTVITVE